MTTGKKVLLGAGVAIGGYILYKMVSPATPVLSKTSSANTSTNLFTAAGQFFSGLISGGNPKSGPNTYGATAPTTWSDPSTYPPGATINPTGPQKAADYVPGSGGGGIPDAQGPTTSELSGPSGATNADYTDGSGDSLLIPSF